MSETIIRKDGSRSTANAEQTDIELGAVDFILEEHIKLRTYGFHTAQVASGAVLRGRLLAEQLGHDPGKYSKKLLAMMGMPSHFMLWQERASARGLLVPCSLSTEIELADAEEGLEIRGGMGEALANPEILLISNYHDEAHRREMSEYENSLAKNGWLLRTESEENDFHAANIAIAVGAQILMLCSVGTNEEEFSGFESLGKKIDIIHTHEIDGYLGDCGEKSSLGTGGMRTKLGAALHAIENGVHKVVIGNSFEDSKALIEDNAGTWVVQ